MKVFLLLPKNGSDRPYLHHCSQRNRNYYLIKKFIVMKNEKLTVLDFKKDQLVNLNEEDMTAVKGGHTSMPCFQMTIKIFDETKDASIWICKPKPPQPDPQGEFYITKHQFVGVTCASVPPIVIYGY